MGISHYYPDAPHYRIVNLDMSEKLGYSYDNPDYAEDEAAFHNRFWHDLIDNMQDKLEAIAPTGWRQGEWDGHAFRIWRTPLFDVTITDNQVLFALVVRTRSDFDGDKEINIAPLHIDRVAKKLFDYIAETYEELSIPHGGYTSGTYTGDINHC
jgi:hypothetical protein